MKIDSKKSISTCLKFPQTTPRKARTQEFARIVDQHF